MNNQTANGRREMNDVRNADNPFRAFYIGKGRGFSAYTDVKNRLNCVDNFSLAECRKALQMDDLQKTVERKIRRRMKKLSVNHE